MKQDMLADWEKFYFPRLRRLTDMPDASADELIDVANYLEWAARSELKLKFPFTDYDKRQVFAMGDRKGFWKYPFSEGQLAVLPNYQLFHVFQEFV